MVIKYWKYGGGETIPMSWLCSSDTIFIYGRKVAVQRLNQLDNRVLQGIGGIMFKCFSSVLFLFYSLGVLLKHPPTHTVVFFYVSTYDTYAPWGRKSSHFLLIFSSYFSFPTRFWPHLLHIFPRHPIPDQTPTV